MQEIDLIIFDCDGTLVDTEAIALRILLTVIQEVGYPMTETEYTERFVGTNIHLIIHYVEEQLGRRIDQAQLTAAYRQRSAIAFAEEVGPIPGMIELVQDLPCHYAVGSNGPREKMQITLAAAGFADFFDGNNIFSAYDIERWKPDPTLFNVAASHFGMRADRTLVVEDTIHGMRAAVAAGMHIVGIGVHHELAAVRELGIPCVKDGYELRQYIAEHYLLGDKTARR